MPTSLKARRLEDINKNGVRAKIPCMRCQSRLADGELAKDFEGCVFGRKTVLWSDLQDDGAQAMRCLICTEAGQDCFAPPDKFLSAFKEQDVLISRLEKNRGALITPASTNEAGERVHSTYEALSTSAREALLKEIKDKAEDILSVIQGSYTPYAKQLTCHSGATDTYDSVQSGLYVKGRDRSNVAVLRRQNEKKRMLEAVDDIEENLSPMRKKKFGLIGRGSTQAELDAKAREAEAAARQAQINAEAAAKAAGGGRKSTRGSKKKN